MAVRSFALLATLALLAVQARAATPVKAFTDNVAYNVGSVVQLKVVSADTPFVDIKATLRYAGDNKAVLSDHPVGKNDVKSHPPTGYSPLWQIPANARTGRYFVDLVGLDPKSRQPTLTLQNAATFVVYKKLVRVETLKLDKTFYTSGDPVSADFSIVNVSHRPLTGLRVEFSNRYWPWIGGPADAAKASVVTLSRNLTIPAGGSKTIHAAHVEVADDVKQPSTHQYGVVVWDHARKTVLDISFSPLAYFQPPAVKEPKPFSGWYLYPTLKDVNTESYRRFYPAGLESPAIQFDRGHTMFPSGGDVEVEFTVKNPTEAPWKGVSIRYRVVGPGGDQLSQATEGGPIDLESGASSGHLHAHFSTAPDAAGLYQIKAEVVSATGDVLAAETLELGVNPLPKSIMIFCAHEDDEGGYTGLTRAAIENHIPIHFVYFTSGDAGSCDAYYQHSCSPADALNFGEIRMDEVRASLGHLGVPPEDILFVGLPDGGSGKIWYDNVNASDPFLDPLLAADHAPYEGLVEPNIPFARNAVVDAAARLIQKFQPEIIATPHPGQVSHIDHIVDNYFVVKALQALAREGSASPSLPVLVNHVEDPKSQPPTPYHYKDLLFHVSGDVATLGQESRWFYMSQGGSRGEGSIRPYDKLPRTEAFRQLLDWNEHEGWNDKRPSARPQ
ncbi:MAG TPA: PIG-L family deacetylase [Terriglobia bacterium]|nr:PIG-L family deacetylase [Terriglobia bacterium]